MKHIVVGDIAGELLALTVLFEEASKRYPGIKLISVGDINDRGPDSKGCIEFVMKNGDSCNSNHGEMMLAFLKPDMGTAYEDACFLMNGGVRTAESYCPGFGIKYLDTIQCTEQYWIYGNNRPPKSDYDGMRSDLLAAIPKEHIDYLESRPMHLVIDDCIITHAPINPTIALDKLTTDPEWKHDQIGLLWNRGKPRRIPGSTQLYGHNSYKSVLQHSDEKGVYAIGIDTSGAKVLTGYIIETNEFIQVTYSGELL